MTVFSPGSDSKCSLPNWDCDFNGISFRCNRSVVAKQSTASSSYFEAIREEVESVFLNSKLPAHVPAVVELFGSTYCVSAAPLMHCQELFSLAKMKINGLLCDRYTCDVTDYDAVQQNVERLFNVLICWLKAVVVQPEKVSAVVVKEVCYCLHELLLDIDMCCLIPSAKIASSMQTVDPQTCYGHILLTVWWSAVQISYWIRKGWPQADERIRFSNATVGEKSLSFHKSIRIVLFSNLVVNLRQCEDKNLGQLFVCPCLQRLLFQLASLIEMDSDQSIVELLVCSEILELSFGKSSCVDSRVGLRRRFHKIGSMSDAMKGNSSLVVFFWRLLDVLRPFYGWHTAASETTTKIITMLFQETFVDSVFHQDPSMWEVASPMDRCLEAYQSLVRTCWAPSESAVLFLVDFFNRISNQIPATAVQFSEPIGWFRRMHSTIEADCQTVDSDLPSVLPYERFLVIVASHCKNGAGERFWKKLKGRLFIQLYPQRLCTMPATEVCVSFAMLLYVSFCTDLQWISARFSELIDKLEPGAVPVETMSALWTVSFVLFHVHRWRRLDCAILCRTMSVSLQKMLKAYLSSESAVQRRVKLWTAVTSYAIGCREGLEALSDHLPGAEKLYEDIDFGQWLQGGQRMKDLCPADVECFLLLFKAIFRFHLNLLGKGALLIGDAVKTLWSLSKSMVTLLAHFKESSSVADAWFCYLQLSNRVQMLGCCNAISPVAVLKNFISQSPTSSQLTMFYSSLFSDPVLFGALFPIDSTGQTRFLNFWLRCYFNGADVNISADMACRRQVMALFDQSGRFVLDAGTLALPEHCFEAICIQVAEMHRSYSAPTNDLVKWFVDWVRCNVDMMLRICAQLAHSDVPSSEAKLRRICFSLGCLMLRCRGLIYQRRSVDSPLQKIAYGIIRDPGSVVSVLRPKLPSLSASLLSDLLTVLMLCDVQRDSIVRSLFCAVLESEIRWNSRQVFDLQEAFHSPDGTVITSAFSKLSKANRGLVSVSRLEMVDSVFCPLMSRERTHYSGRYFVAALMKFYEETLDFLGQKMATKEQLFLTDLCMWLADADPLLVGQLAQTMGRIVGKLMTHLEGRSMLSSAFKAALLSHVERRCAGLPAFMERIWARRDDPGSKLIGQALNEAIELYCSGKGKFADGSNLRYHFCQRPSFTGAMGGHMSLSRNLSNNELLRRFSGLESINDNDPFWNLLLSFNFKPPTDRVDCQCLDEQVKDILESLLYNTATTGNFAALVRVFLRRSEELRASEFCHEYLSCSLRVFCTNLASGCSKVFLWQTTNALLLLRYCCRFFAQHLVGKNYENIFSHTVLSSDGRLEVVENHDSAFGSNMEEFVNALISVICDLPVEELSIKILTESLCCLICMMSSELYHANVERSEVTDLILFGKCAVHAPVLTKTLLNCYVQHSNVSCHYETDEQFGGGSFVVGLAASLLNILHVKRSEKEQNAEAPLTLGDIGVCCLLLLVGHSAPDGLENPYRQALVFFINSQEHAAQTCPTQAAVCFKFNFASLYEQLCCRNADRPTLLLLYFLVYKNVGFRNYVLSRINLDQLLVPILKVLYDGEMSDTGHGGSQHVYLALIILLIFSEDDFFCKVVHEMPAKCATWFSERNARESTLGSLVVYTLLRIIQKNVFVIRDRYLQTNCLAALANMSSNFKDLPPFICQRLIFLLDKLSKRHSRFMKNLELSAKYDLPETENNASEIMQDISVLEEAMRMLMEIFNSALSSNVNHNVHLVYAILYQRELFRSLEQYSIFQDLIWNIAAVINFFTSRISQTEAGASVEDVVSQIREAAIHWLPEGLKKFPELKFKYVEDTSTQDFFVPYIWKIVCEQCSLHPDLKRVKLFVA